MGHLIDGHGVKIEGWSFFADAGAVRATGRNQAVTCCRVKKNRAAKGSPAETRDAQVMQLRSKLELQSEADLPLAVGNLRPLVFDLAKLTIAFVGVRTVEPGSVEGIEVIYRENALEVLSHVEVLSGIQAFAV